jgi:hypothetical protein
MPVPKSAKSEYYIRHVYFFVSAKNNDVLTERIFIFDIRVFFENLSRNFKFLRNVMRIPAALNEDICTCMISC